MFKKILIVILSLSLTGLIFLFVISLGKTSPIVDTDGNIVHNSIAIIEKPIIGGIPQGMIIRGTNIENPILLFVHGGCGVPSFPWIKNDFKRLENLFTICYWEQRGAGMSYSKNIPPGTMTLDQLVEDAAQVTRYLMKKFNKQKIYILGHSWGTFLSSFTVHKYPELYYAYLGVGQIANSYLSEEESYKFVVTEAKKRNDEKAQKELEKLKFPAIDAPGKDWWEYYKIQREYVFKFGGAMYGRARNVNDLRKAVLFCREYTLTDKFNYAKGVSFSQSYLGSSLMSNNFNKVLREQQVPVYIFQGIHDHQTSYKVAKEYFNNLKAPEKRFYTFNSSAHSPHIEEYDTFEKIIITDILCR